MTSSTDFSDDHAQTAPLIGVPVEMLLHFPPEAHQMESRTAWASKATRHRADRKKSTRAGGHCSLAETGEKDSEHGR
jgi:hypothetical protein